MLDVSVRWYDLIFHVTPWLRSVPEKVRTVPSPLAFFFSFVTCWHFPTSALLIIILIDLRKGADDRKCSCNFSQYEKRFIEELPHILEKKNLLTHLEEAAANISLAAWTETHPGTANKWPRIFISIWGYEDIVMGPLYALSLGDLDPDIAGLLSSFQVLSQLKWSVSCDCANNRGS